MGRNVNSRMPTLQAYTISGHMIEMARWSVNTLQNLHLDDIIYISMTSEDKTLLKWITSVNNREISAERIGKQSKGYSVIMAFRVSRFKHMLDGNDPEIDSMAMITPMNRDIEHAIIYILDPNKADPRFVNMLLSKNKT